MYRTERVLSIYPYDYIKVMKTAFQTASFVTLHSQSSLSVSFTYVSPCPALLIHSARLGKGLPSGANSSVNLPSDPWPWADKVTSHNFYSRFCLHTSLCVALLEIVSRILSVMKGGGLRGSGQTCCSDALQAQADKNIKTMTAKYERWTKPQRMLEREESKRWQSGRSTRQKNSAI